MCQCSCSDTLSGMLFPAALHPPILQPMLHGRCLPQQQQKAPPHYANCSNGATQDGAEAVTALQTAGAALTLGVAVAAAVLTPQLSALAKQRL
jgi:hypothetical protein